MNDTDKTKKQLKQELDALRLKIPVPGRPEKASGETFGFSGRLPEDFYRDFLENTNDLIQTITPDGRFLFVNDAWLNTMGYDRNEIHKLLLTDIIHPDSRVHCSNFMDILKKDIPLEIFQTELITRQKKKVIVEASVHAHYSQDEPVYIQCILRDITERQRFEKALMESEKKYVDFYQNAPDGYHSLGPDGTILEVNNTWLRMFGYSRDEIIGKVKLTALLDEEGTRVFQKTFRRLKETGFVDNIHYMIKAKDGSEIPVLISASAIYDDQGNFLKTRTLVRDISARMQFRTMLEQALEEWRVTFDSMPCGVILLNLEFAIVRANIYIASLYSLPVKDLKERSCFELIRSDHLKESYFGIRSQSKLNIRPFEYYEDTVSRYFMISLTPIPDASGMTKAFVLTMVDISELKDKQKKLSESKEAFFNMLKELDFSYRELRELHDGLIHSFVNAIDAKSPWTKGHSERVTKYAVAIGKAMGVEGEEMNILRNASLLHDIGKIGTYDIILDNPKRLTPEEHDLINLHPVKGEAILRPIKQLQVVLPIIRHHHEQIDGTGYPDGLKGDKIPLFARILCVADSFDSMISDRPYRPARNKEYAISELQRCSGTQFDPAVVKAFLDILDDMEISRKDV